ncbi:MAG TPA: hypothetical protein VGF75_00240 [Candidatus Saccharimonadales bacterium]|jgi:hypothetical protein
MNPGNHLIAGLAKPYLIGARLQIRRYVEAQSLCKESSTLGVYLCMHEVSNLFEDLDMLAKYLERMVYEHPDHQLWFDCRRHIRHDLREQLDRVEERKTDRAKRLKIHKNLQMDIGFEADGLKVGQTPVKMYRVEAYLDWADGVINDIFNEAIGKGLIKVS